MKGRRVGRYVVERELGAGGAGRVLLAHGPDGDPVAIKVFHDRPSDWNALPEEVLDLHHANLVRTLERGTLRDDDLDARYVVMEYVEGHSLRDLLEQSGRLPESLCLYLAGEIAKPLSVLHAASLLHLDVKPENVMVTPDQTVKVMDLLPYRSSERSAAGTGAGGSLAYAAPEQLTGPRAELDGRADLYALGVTLFELATGRRPYPEDESARGSGFARRERTPSVRTFNAGISHFFDDLVRNLLSWERDQRVASASELVRIAQEREHSEWWLSRSRPDRGVVSPHLLRTHSTALHGRARSLQRLQQCFEQAAEGAGQAVMIRGEAGIGKSRLVEELCRWLETVRPAPRCLYGSYVDRRFDSTTTAYTNGLRAYLSGLVVEHTLERHLVSAPELVPAMAALLEGRPPPAGVTPLTTGSLEVSILEIVRSLAADRPLVIVVEDLHFAPTDAIRYFERVARAIAHHDVLLVGTSRSKPTGDSDLHELTLERLGDEDVRALIADDLRSDVTAEHLDEVVRSASGIPFLAMELLRDLRREGRLLRLPDGTWGASAPIDALRVPTAVRRLIDLRLSRLDAQERRIIDMAACCGTSFEPTLVAAALGVPAEALRPVLARIESLFGLLRRVGDGWAFEHDLTYRAARDAVSPDEARRHHGALAGLLRTRSAHPDTRVSLCEHLIQSEDPQAAGPFVEHALQHLEASLAPQREQALARAALETPGVLEGAARVRTCLRHAELLGDGGSRADLGRILSEANDIAHALGDDRLTCRCLMARAQSLVAEGKHGAAERLNRQALELAKKTGDRGLEAHTQLDLARRQRMNGRPLAHVARRLRVARALAGRASLPDLEHETLLSLGLLLHDTGRTREAIDILEHAASLVENHADKRRRTRSYGLLGFAYMSDGRIREAREISAEALALARSVGYRDSERKLIFTLATAESVLGNFKRMRMHAERGLAMAQANAYLRLEMVFKGLLGDASYGEGHYGQALEHLRIALRFFEARNEPLGLSSAAASMGRLQFDLGRFTEAGRSFELALEHAHRLDNANLEAQALTGLGRLAEACGDLPLALERQQAALACIDDASHHRGLHVTLRLRLAETNLAIGHEHQTRLLLRQAFQLAQDFPASQMRVLPAARLSLLGELDPEAAEAELAEYGSQLALRHQLEAHLLLWERRASLHHVRAMSQILSYLREHAPHDDRDPMIVAVPLHRRVQRVLEQAGDADVRPAASPAVPTDR